MTKRTKNFITTTLGVVVLVFLLGVVGTLEQRCDRREYVLRGMDKNTYFAIRQHVSDSIGRAATRSEVADYYIQKEGL